MIINGADAGLITTTATNPSQTFFAAANDDLINQGQTTLAGETHTGYTPFTFQGGTSTTAALNDGIIGAAWSNPSDAAKDTAFDLDGTWTSTYDLSLAFSPAGYDITEVRTIAGWVAQRATQRYELLVSYVGDAGFASLGTFSLEFFEDGSSQITLTDSTGVIASGVDAVQFRVLPPLDPFVAVADEVSFREFDVFGGPSPDVAPVPDPSSLILLAFGGLTAGGIRCRRWRLAI